MVSNPDKVRIFLSQVQGIIFKPNGFQFIKRRKNLDSMNKHGLSIKTVKMYVANLTYRDYCEGPVKDTDFPGFVWIFGKKINNVWFYIKIKIKQEKLLCCLSFHEAEFYINFPYK